VMLLPSLKAPAYGWGGINKQMVGILLSQDPHNDNISVKWPSHPNWKGKKGELQRADELLGIGTAKKPIVLDLRIRATYAVRGGILADKIGYGKTATTIALIDRGLGKPPPAVPEVDRGRFIQAKGTLIILPSNLFEQWITEIAKFVWDGKPLRRQMKGGWSPRGCPMKILAMSNVSPLAKAKASDLAEADVVICSYRLLYSNIYIDRCKELCEGSSKLSQLPPVTKALLEGRANLRSGRKGQNMVSNWEDLEFPLLEMFYWRRIVFDEFHELESVRDMQQNSLQFLRSHFRWGLTGTPALDNNAGGIFMSSLFRIDLPGYLQPGTRKDGDFHDLRHWEADRLLTETCGHFFDAFARQNTAELPHIGLQEHVIVVRHSPAERALYLGQAHDTADFSEIACATEEKRAGLERLLKLCSHFQAGRHESVGNATEECERIFDQKERRQVRARNQVRRCCRVMILLEQKLTAKAKSANKKWLREVDQVQETLKADDSGKLVCKEFADEVSLAKKEDSQLWLQCLDGHRPRDEELLCLLGPNDQQRGCFEQWVAFQASKVEEKVLLRLLEAQGKEQAQNLKEVHEAASSLDFFRRTVAAVGGGSPEERICTVCLEEDLPLAKLAITPCAHAFCMDCLHQTVEKFGACSICRRKLTKKDVQPLAVELEASKAAKAGTSSSSSQAETVELAPTGVRFDKYGTKLAMLVQKLNELRKKDPSAKVILFVQFDDLKQKVSTALAEFGVPCATLQGGVGQRASIIRDWQYNPHSATFVLLLSLGQSASGTNLTAASHVVFLHPMLAASADRAVSYELQAIGRARRHGQQRKEVHVWRFVTAGTLEQDITEQHQGVLWQREQARQKEHDEMQQALRERQQRQREEMEQQQQRQDEQNHADG